MRIVFTGGGTGGHIFPNIAVIEEFRRLGEGSQQAIFYIGERDSLEEHIIRERGIPFYGIYAGKLRRYFDFRNFLDFPKIPVGFLQAYKILKSLAPDLVFAKGGYVSVPVVFAAKFLGIPVWIHESDVTPGLATKLCSFAAQKIWLSFEESKAFFKNKNAEVVGNPVRSGIVKGEQEKGYKLTGFSPKHPVLLILGGSSGAKSLNELVAKILDELTAKRIQVAHITGRGNAALMPLSPFYIAFPFLGEDLKHMYAISNLVVSRAGSGTIFEVLSCGKPLLLIPLPRRASRGDQIENAHVCEHNGWAQYLEQESLTPKKLLDSIFEMLKHPRPPKDFPFKSAARKIADKIFFRGKPTVFPM